MIDLSECTWQMFDTCEQSGPEDHVLFAFFESGRSYQQVQWFACGDRYCVEPYFN